MRYLLAGLLLLFSGTVYAQQPPNDPGIWYVVKHVRFPIPDDKVVGGPYGSWEQCISAKYDYEHHSQFFTDYGCEHRLSSKLKRTRKHGS